jgi:hypothetical protein
MPRQIENNCFRWLEKISAGCIVFLYGVYIILRSDAQEFQSDTSSLSHQSHVVSCKSSLNHPITIHKNVELGMQGMVGEHSESLVLGPDNPRIRKSNLDRNAVVLSESQSLGNVSEKSEVQKHLKMGRFIVLGLQI